MAHADVDSTVNEAVEDPEVTDAASFGRKVLREARAEDLPMLAASIAYQAFVSLIPLLALLFLAVRAVGDQALAEQALQFTRSFLPGPGQELLRGYIVGETTVGLTGAGLIGFVTLVWGAFKIFRGLDKAFSEIYDTDETNSFVDQLKDSAVVIGSLIVAITAAVLATTVFAIFENIPFVGLLSPLFLAVGLAIAFTPMYYEFPDLDLSWKEVLPGVAVAAVGWAILQSLFQVYLSFTGKASAADIIGAVLVLLTWLYFGGMVLLLGAVVNAVVKGKRALGETYDPSEAGSASATASGSVSGAQADGENLDRERAELERERQELGYERRRLKYRRQELERERREPDEDADVAELRRQVDDLERRLRWYDKPLRTRLVWRALGRTPERQGDAESRLDDRAT